MPDKSNQSSATTCKTFGPAAVRTVAYAIDLTGFAAGNSLALIDKALQDDKVAKKLADELKKAGEKLMKQQAGGKSITLENSAGKVAGAAEKVLKDPVIKQLKKTPQFRRFDSSLTQFKCEFENSPVGVFVNENKTTLIIVGAVAAIGGGVAMYHFKAGDTATAALKLLPEVSVMKIGAVDLSVKNLEFKPSKQQVGAAIKVSGKWDRVQTQVEFGATIADEKLTKAAGKGSLVLKFDPSLQLSAKGAFSWSKADAETRRKISGGAAIGMKKTFTTDTSLSLQIYGDYADEERGKSKSFGLKSGLSVKDVVGDKSKLTVSPSYERRLFAPRLPNSPNQVRSEDRVMINLKLEFDWGR